jgi:hypothetical protein
MMPFALRNGLSGHACRCQMNDHGCRSMLASLVIVGLRVGSRPNSIGTVFFSALGCQGSFLSIVVGSRELKRLGRAVDQ